MAIFEMRNAEEAKKVIAGLDNTPMDRAHTFHAYRYADIVSVLANSEEVALPVKEKFAPLAKATEYIEDAHKWMDDPLQRDQFCIRYNNNTEVYWCDSPNPISALDKTNQSLSLSLDKVMWSPLGTYLATFHSKGVILHAGPQLMECGRFSHVGVDALLFSSQERYAVTWNGQLGVTYKDAICIWDVASNQVLRKFPCTDKLWPSYSFSADERFLATKGTNGIGIFELPSMQMVPRSCFGVPNIREFTWSPAGSLLAYTIPETNGKPATVVVLDVARDARVQAVSFTNVEEVQIAWAPSGEFLAVVVARYPKKRGKNLTYQISVVRVKERNAPSDALVLAEKVEQLRWEPQGTRFALLTAAASGARNVSFYSVYRQKGGERVNETCLLYTVTNKPCNNLFWSPMGNYLLIAGLGTTLKGRLEFWDVTAQASLKEQEHFSCTNVEWSPNGHFCVTSSCYNTSNKQDYENGYDVWDNRGERVFHTRLPRFISLQFRPWPLATLSEEQRKNDYENGYDVWDNRGERVFHTRLPRFISLQFRPWPLATLSEEQRKNVKKMLPLTSEKYRKQHEQMEALKHISEIRKKLEAIDAFLAKKKELCEKMAAVEAERKQRFGKEPERVEVSRLVEEVIDVTEEVC
ncbi:eukaryotic translation initiation factor 3 subunit B [Blastocystis sp. ATCC 50177/Nand II]|uniref:Eukaryotic translation initiation factor 3 subunit B n=1 Tax=Blastocystis sp. subtype 1 (strain ATCC 50177 / NandII) TaxID=478820 RepID=A0A196S8G8_BLAHN|nr:eukaryotic translation initiation factor 3 subunit B [Blastocystis sp. ATCC 50177/Nand II]